MLEQINKDIKKNKNNILIGSAIILFTFVVELAKHIIHS
jgi:hypothetical protein